MGVTLDDDFHGPDGGRSDDADLKQEKKSASTLLVDIAIETYRFGISDAGETFAVPLSGPKVVSMLRGGKTSLRALLARGFFKRHGRAAGQQALADALLVIEGIAQDQEPETLYLRVAEHCGALWLDLGDPTGRVVQISRTGWTLLDQSPVLFKRTGLTTALPEPVAGASLDELWGWLNVTAEDQPLVAAWLVAALRPDIPHPILGLFGEQGTGKTTAEKVLVSVLDPSAVPTRKPPRDAESWVTAASCSWVVGLDNLSAVPDWLSDSLCRAVTGDGDVRRKLYTDGELAVFAFRRCIVVAGIDLGAINGDFAERLLSITLDIIEDEARLEENELWPGWTLAHPRILGAVLDLAAGVAEVFPSVRLESKPRMADFARVLAAVDRKLDTDGLNRYRAKEGAMATDSLTGDDFVTAMTAKLNGKFEGTSAELLTLVTPTGENWRAPKGWPTNARAVTQRLTKQAPVMRKAGWTISDDDGANKDKVVRWEIARPEMARIGDPPPPQHPRKTEQAGQAGQAGDEYGPSQDEHPLCSRCGLPMTANDGSTTHATCDPDEMPPL
jgi:hypothetical protein